MSPFKHPFLKLMQLMIIVTLITCLLSGCLKTSAPPASQSASETSQKITGTGQEPAATATPAATNAPTAAPSAPTTAAVPTTAESSAKKPAADVSAAPSTSAAPTTTAATTAAPAIVTVTIPEGYTLAKICLLLANKGVNTFDKLFAYATTADFSQYAFLPPVADTPNRCFRLEGYLFPDTYTFYTQENPASVFKRLLDHFAAKTAGYAAAAAAKGLTLDQAVIIASLIEKEATAAERANVSAVIHNRLKAGMKLEFDSTITYCEYVIRDYAVNAAPESYFDEYNTYKCPKLPAGAIGNPGLAAIKAAINPSDLTALFFFTKSTGEFIYSDTYEDHLAKMQAK